MGVSKERMRFLKWRRENYPLLRTSDHDSHDKWVVWQARAALDAESQKPTTNSDYAAAMRVWHEWGASAAPNDEPYMFWLHQRLNSEEPNCA